MLTPPLAVRRAHGLHSVGQPGQCAGPVWARRCDSLGNTDRQPAYGRRAAWTSDPGRRLPAKPPGYSRRTLRAGRPRMAGAGRNRTYRGRDAPAIGFEVQGGHQPHLCPHSAEHLGHRLPSVADQTAKAVATPQPTTTVAAGVSRRQGRAFLAASNTCSKAARYRLKASWPAAVARQVVSGLRSANVFLTLM